MTVVVRFAPDQALYVREREWHPTRRFATRPDRYLHMTFRAGGRFEIARWILGWGPTAEAGRPAALREDVVAALDRAGARCWPLPPPA